MCCAVHVNRERVCVCVGVHVPETRKNVIISHNNLVVALCRAHFNLMTIIFIKMISVTMIHTHPHGNKHMYNTVVDSRCCYFFLLNRGAVS